MLSFVKSGIAVVVTLAALCSAAPATALNFIQPAGSPYSTGALTSNSVLTGDLNGDGRDDVVTANAEYSFSVFLAGPNGSMTQAAGSPFSTGSDYALSGTLLDFNGDGKLDVAIATNNKVRIFPGTGTGSFGSATTIATAVNGEAITTGHFSEDPYPDLAVVGSSTDNVQVIFGDGAGGTLGNVTVTVGDSPVSIVAADFDEDGIDDFATANLNVNAGIPPLPGAVSVYISFDGVDTYDGYFQPRGISAGDYNDDGHQDFAVVSRADRQLLVKLGTDSGGFTDSPTVPLIDSQWGNSDASADFNGDGYEDLLIGMASNLSDPLTDSAPVFLGSSAGSLTVSPDGPWVTTSPAYPWQVATGDFNADGHPDWVSGDQGGRVSVFMNEAPAVTADPTTLNFPDVPVGGDSTPLTATLTNTGVGPVNIDEGGVTITGTDAGDYAIDSEDCESQTLDSGDSCEVAVVFSPSSVGGKSATLNVAHDAAGSPTTVALSGTGTANPGIEIDPTSHDFGDARITVDSDSAPQTFTVESSGTTPLEIDSVTLTGANADQFEIDSETCTGASPIAPDGGCEVIVDFSPTTVGAKSASLSLTTNVSGSPQTAALSGTGTPFAYPTFDPTSLDFGPVPIESGATAPLTVTMEANGASPLVVETLGIDQINGNPDDFAIVDDGCLGETLQVGETCQFSVVFDPTAIGERNGLIKYSMPGIQGVLFAEGDGIDPGRDITPGANDFGTRLTDEGPGAPQVFTLTSAGTTDLETGTVSLTGVAADQFQLTADGCSNRTLAPEATCDVSVAFAPTSAGEKTAELDVATNAVEGPATAQLTGSGQDPVPPPDPCEPIAIKKVAYFTPSVKKRSNIPGVRARITTAGPAVVRISSKVIYHLRGKQGKIKYPQRQFQVAGKWTNYKVAIPKKLRKKLKPKKKVRFVISYASKAKNPECTKFGPTKTRNLTTRIVWVIPNA